MKRRSSIFLLLLAPLVCGVAGAAPIPLPVTEKPPHIGYAYPAGGRQGAEFEVKVGGENIYGATAADVSGKGVAVRILDARDPDEGKEEFKRRRKRNRSVIAETVTLKVSIAADAPPGNRDLCLVLPSGVSNKLVFQVGQLPEVTEKEGNDKPATATALPALPVTVNGQISPGDTDWFTFSARQGGHLVIQASARELIPYLADAVPGWFQALLTVQDAQGREVAVADSFRFNQDPVLLFDVPATGEYRVGIRDSIYRGREDFVYRLRIGELPFITGVFPLGAPGGRLPATVHLSGKNLPAATTAVDVSANPATPVRFISVTRDGLVSNRVPFAVGDLPELLEDDELTMQEAGQPVTPPVVVNGRISVPGEKDLYQFAGKQGQTINLDVRARRLGSPLDSRLVLLNSRGEKVGENDDAKDPGEGLLTHQADSELHCRLPETGAYFVQVADTQGQGGAEFAYRLRIAPPDPNFDLRLTPAAVSIPKGGSAPVTIHVVRRDGFTGEIRLALDSFAGAWLTLDAGVIPAGVDRIRATLSAAAAAPPAKLAPVLRGTATANGKTVIRTAAPAEDLMQAFIYHHLTPFRELEVMVTEPAAPFTVAPRLPPAGVLEMPRGREIVIPVTVVRRPGFTGPVRFQLVDPPKGIALRGGGIPPGRNEGVVTLLAETKDTPAGLTENLVLTAMMPLEREPTPEERVRIENRLGKTTAPAAPAGAPGKPAGEGGKTPAVPGKPAAAPGTPAPAVSGTAAKAAAPADDKKPLTVIQRITVTLPAIPFKVVEPPERKPDHARQNRVK